MHEQARQQEEAEQGQQEEAEQGHEEEEEQAEQEQEEQGQVKEQGAGAGAARERKEGATAEAGERDSRQRCHHVQKRADGAAAVAARTARPVLGRRAASAYSSSFSS